MTISVILTCVFVPLHQTLKTAVQIQTQILQALFPQANQANEAALFPKIRKSCRSFKEVAEVSISQLEFIL